MDNKTFTDKMAKELGIPAERVGHLVGKLTEIIGKRCSDLDTITLPGFGTFEPHRRNERVAVHPATGERLLVPPKIVMGFRPSTSFKQKIKHGK